MQDSSIFIKGHCEGMCMWFISETAGNDYDYCEPSLSENLKHWIDSNKKIAHFCLNIYSWQC